MILVNAKAKVNVLLHSTTARFVMDSGHALPDSLFDFRKVISREHISGHSIDVVEKWKQLSERKPYGLDHAKFFLIRFEVID